MIPLLWRMMACEGGETGDTGNPSEGTCCCEFLVEGDIVIEDLLDRDECTGAQDGECIQVDPNRLTPHPCCPDATGERCGDG